MSGTKQYETVDVIVSLLVTLLTLPLMILWSGVQIMLVWNWWAPALPFGLPRLALAQAVGISMIWGMMTSSLARVEPKNKDTLLGEVVWSLLRSLLIGSYILLVAYVTRAILL